jgi:hypothetical protein
MAGILDFITSKDPDSVERRLRLAQGLSGMSTNPNAGLQNSIQGRIDGIQTKRTNDAALDLASKQANTTLTALKAAGVPDEVLAVAKANPTLFKEIASSLVKSKMGGGDMLKFSGVQTDPTSGEQYTVMSDPNKGTSVKVPVANAIQQTPQQKIDMEGLATNKTADIAMAKTKGFAAFDRASGIDESLTKLESARKAVNNGASSGVMAGFFPSFNAATTALRTTANSLGIDIINSATFGALSEKELQLALSTGLDLSLQGDELKTHIAAKIDAQTKMRDWLMDQAQILTQGDTTYSSYIQKYNAEKPRANPIVNFAAPQGAGGGSSSGGLVLSASQIKSMTPAQKTKFEQLTGVKLP